MPKSRSKPDPFDLELLAKAIQARYDVVVTDNRSLLKIIDLIFQAGYKTELGWNTWRRLFGLISNDHSQSITTLNILSEFAGFSSWADFLQNNTLEKERDFQHRFSQYVAGNIHQPDIEQAFVALGPSAAFYRFLQQCLILYAGRNDSSILQYIYANNQWFPFDVLNKEAAYEEFNLHQLVGIYCFKQNLPGFTNALVQNPTSLKKVLQYCVHYGPSAESYMKCFESAFSDGLFDDEPDFANSILSYHAHLIGDISKAKAHLNPLENYALASQRLLPAGRIRILQWIHGQNNQLISDKQIKSIVHEDYLFFKDKAKHLDAFSFYMLYVIRYLCNNKRSSLAIQLINRYFPFGPTSISFWSGVIWNRLRIYLADAQVQTGAKDDALQTFNKVKPEWFDTFQFNQDRADYFEVAKHFN